MKRTPLFLATTLALCLAIPTWAQIQINAPTGWKTQIKAGGAKTFTPPDLKAGEKYSVTIYNPAPLKGKTPEAWLRAFAGPVGTKPGQLAAPLKFERADGRIAIASGLYRGPKGDSLVVVFQGVSFDDGQTIHVARTLSSPDPALLERYSKPAVALAKALKARAKAESGEDETEDETQEKVIVPEAIWDSMKRGGALVPGVYAGKQITTYQTLSDGVNQCRVDLYANGEYRVVHSYTGQKVVDESSASVGKYEYDAPSGKIDISDQLSNYLSPYSSSNNKFCFFGHDAAGKPYIYAEKGNTVTTLRYIGPPTQRPVPSIQKARDEAIKEAETRYKWVKAPGKGVSNAQIEAVLWDQTTASDQMSVSFESYLLLRDGTIRVGLPVAIDEMDISRSRQKEPEVWGRWRRDKNKNYQVSWQGAAWEPLAGLSAIPGAPGTRLDSYFGTSRGSGSIGVGQTFSIARWGISFGKTGRFSTDSSGSSSSLGVGDGSVSIQSGYDKNGSYVGASGAGVVVGSIQKRNPNGDREGTYSINGYTLTLRYDSGKTERLPFFFDSPKRSRLWFGSGLLLMGG